MAAMTETPETMSLADYLEAEGLNYEQFARLIGAKNGRTVQRYVVDGRVPSPKMIAAIELATGGKVPPGSFYPSALTKAA